MPSPRHKLFQITLDGETVELSHELVKFYLKETQRQVPRRSSMEKFFNNMIRHYADRSSFNKTD